MSGLQGGSSNPPTPKFINWFGRFGAPYKSEHVLACYTSRRRVRPHELSFDPHEVSNNAIFVP